MTRTTIRPSLETLELRATPDNTAPTISDIASRTTSVGVAMAPIGFTVGDAETQASLLKVSAASSNPGLVTSLGLAFGGFGNNRTITVNPVPGQTGSTVITMTVTDAGGLTATDTFTVTVTDGDPQTSPQAVIVGTGNGGSPKIQLRHPTTGALVSQLTVGDPLATSGVRVAAADVTGDGVLDYFVGTGPGVSNAASLYDGSTKQKIRDVPAFEASFTGGLYVAAGDVTGDGVPELVIAAGEGGGPRVRVLDGASGDQLADFFAIDDPNFRGGARPSLGDMNGDTLADLIVSAGEGGGPRVAGFNGASLRSNLTPQYLFDDFFAFEPELRNGAYLAVGDVTGDGKADLAAGAGPGGGPRVYLLNGASLLNNQINPVANFFDGDVNARGGVTVAMRDVDGDGKADLITGSGAGSLPRLNVYATPDLLASPEGPSAYISTPVFETTALFGVYVG
jgi:hypothetical protein